MPEIDIILYHGGPLKNVNANKGLPFEGPGIKTYYTQIDRRLKTLDELKKIIMEELCENPAIHNIQITYRMPNEILKHRINYKYMVIETDKHVKIMFDKLERIGEVTNIELYIQLEPRAVWEEDIQQTTTSLQVMVPDAQYEYSTHVEDDYVHADGDVHVDDDDDDDDDDDYVDETTAINNDDDDDDDDYVDENIAINGEDFVDRDEYKDTIGRDLGDFERDIDDDQTLDGSESYVDNVISVQNITNTIPAYAPPVLSFSANPCAWACNSTLSTGPCTYGCCACAWDISSCWFSLMPIVCLLICCRITTKASHII